jgi:hypothetical protein
VPEGRRIGTDQGVNFPERLSGGLFDVFFNERCQFLL